MFVRRRSTAHLLRSYIETIRILYRCTTFFGVQRPKIIATGLPRLLSTNHLENLRSIQLRWKTLPEDHPYPGLSIGSIRDHPQALTKAAAAFRTYDAVWAALTALPGLRELRVALQTTFLETGNCMNSLEMPVAELREAWLGPTARLKDERLAVFELSLGASWVGELWDWQRCVEASDYT